MDKIIDYLNSYPKYTLILVLTLLVCFIIIALITIFYKKSKSIKLNELQKNQENEQISLTFKENSEKIQLQNPNFVQNEDEPKNVDETTEKIESQQEHNNLLSIEAPTSEPIMQDALIENNKEKNQSEKVEETLDIPNPPQATEEEAPTTTRYNGKWIIYQAEERYFADLKASNGELMLRTESYATLSGIKSGIETLKKNIENENFAISLDKNGNFVFKIFSTSKRLLCVGEGYSSREQCEKAFNSVKRFSKTAKIIVYRESE